MWGTFPPTHPLTHPPTHSFIQRIDSTSLCISYIIPHSNRLLLTHPPTHPPTYLPYRGGDGNVKDLLAYEYEQGDEFEGERIREFADWFKDIDAYKEGLLESA